MARFIAPTIAGVFALLSLVHIYWAFAGKGLSLAVLPERDGKPTFQPSLGSTLLVSVLLGLAGLLVLSAAHIGPSLLPPLIVAVGIWVVAAAMLGRAVGDFRYVGFFKRIRGTRFAALDTWLYSPLALLLGAGTSWVAAAGS